MIRGANPVEGSNSSCSGSLLHVELRRHARADPPDACVARLIFVRVSSLHPLKCDLMGHWAVWVSGNWRMTFAFDDGDAVLVDYQDYH
jgi:hypothetical protein